MCPGCGFLHAYAGYRHQWAYIGGAKSGVLALVQAHVYEFRCFFDEPECRLHHIFGAAHKGDYSAVGGFSRVDVQEFYSFYGFYYPRYGFNLLAVATLRNIGHTFYNLAMHNSLKLGAKSSRILQVGAPLAFYIRSVSFAQVRSILKDMKAGKVKPVYFLQGEEPYFIDAIAEYVEHHLMPPEQRDFNMDVVYGSDVNMDNLRVMLRQYPMMFDYRLVLIKEAQNIDRIKEKFADYLAQPSPNTVLVICYKYKKIADSKLVKQVQSHGVWFESKPPRDQEVEDWILETVAQKGFTIHAKARRMLVEYLGNDLSKVSNELKKLFVALEKGQEINIQHIEDNVGISKEFNVFELQDALSAMQRERALRIVFYLSENEKDHPLPMVLSILFGFFSKVLACQYLKNPNPDMVKQALGMNWGVERIMQAARLYSPVKVVAILRRLRELDRKSKGLGNVSADNGILLRELGFFMLN
jgi:DNA polymerase-3 subunit delta